MAKNKRSQKNNTIAPAELTTAASQLSAARPRRGATPPWPFDKYDLYRRAVQGPETDAEFIRDVYRELRGRSATDLREDFCGTFAICCEWVKLNSKNHAVGIDLDSEPIAYGIAHYLSKLNPKQKARLQVQQADVLNPGLPKSDVICAMNFSHFIFKDLHLMKSYFHNCLSTLKPGGILLTDCFGGSACYDENEESSKHKDFTYYWHQENFDPVTNFAKFNIHFKPKGQKKARGVFTYDWRLWTIPEIREIMHEVGFQKTHVYWEGTTRKGEGDGNFKRVTTGEECISWIAYIVGEK